MLTWEKTSLRDLLMKMETNTRKSGRDHPKEETKIVFELTRDYHQEISQQK